MTTTHSDAASPGDDPSDLLATVSRLEMPECDCPLYLSCPCRQDCPRGERDSCPHCREECDCPPLLYQPPCHHVTRFAASMKRHLPLPEWTDLLWGARPALFASRPPRPHRQPLVREERVELYEARAGLRLDLFHPEDAAPFELADDEYTETNPDAWRGRR